MKIKLDFWVTPDGYVGTGPDKAQHVKGYVEVSDAPLLALLTALSPPVSAGLRNERLDAAIKLLDTAMEETQDG